MLRLPGHWVWDFWTADDGDLFHLFYLMAPTNLEDPRRRHRAARIGHSVSSDLSRWSEHDSPYEVGGGGAFDETATWTGCVVRGDDGQWRMFYTGARFLENEPGVMHTERVGLAVSADLEHWVKRPGSVAAADPRWYETIEDAASGEESWRDPWVFKDPSGHGWHMLLTARANVGPSTDRGVIGHAYSTDLETWEVRAPLSSPGSGFVHLEVPQVVQIGGQWILLFSCATDSLAPTSRHRDQDVGTWALPVDSPVGPFDITRARPITTSGLYSCRAVPDRSGGWVLLGFLNGPNTSFPGVVTDPIPLDLDPDGYPRPAPGPHIIGPADAIPPPSTLTPTPRTAVTAQSPPEGES